MSAGLAAVAWFTGFVAGVAVGLLLGLYFAPQLWTVV